MGKNKSRFVYLFLLLNTGISQYSCAFNKNPFSIKERKKVFEQTRLLVGYEEDNRSNSGKVIDNVINYTRLYKYEQRPYCGATVQYCIEHAGFKIPEDVKYPLKARGWFNSNVIYVKGHYKGLTKEEPRLCDIIGFNFYGRNITHVGFYLWELNSTELRTFEGNTSNPKKKGSEGFFDKKRKKNISIIRRLDF